jgi:hypothetical protein
MGGRVPGPLGARQRKHRHGHHKTHQAGPIAAHSVDPAVTAPIASTAVLEGGLSLDELKAEVLKRQTHWHITVKRRTFCANLADSELTWIEGKFRMRIVAAKQCGDMLIAAREALEEARSTGDEKALATAYVGIHSAYRNIAEDTAAWKKAFNQYYTETRNKRDAMADGPHGPSAINLLTNMMCNYKAAPGYSNHSNGLAVDFKTVYKAHELKAAKAQRAAWRLTWLHRWLVENARSFGFQPLDTEEWHWDFVGVEAAMAGG